MAKIHKESQPKYLDLNGMTQYEMAQSIDAAIEAAENSYQQDNMKVALQLVYGQAADQMFEEYGIQVDSESVLGSIQDGPSLLGQLEALIPLCGVRYQLLRGQDAALQDFQQELSQTMDRIVQTALDILHARNLWRFDIERTIRRIKEPFSHAIQQYQF